MNIDGMAQFFIIGFVAWFATGLDDLLAVIALVKTNGVKTAVAVMSGVILAAISAFFISAVIVFRLVGPETISEYRHWTGLILIMVGFISLRSTWWELNSTRNLNKPEGMLQAIGVSYLAYLANTLDDMSSDCVWLLQTKLEWTKVVGLFAGNLTAVVIAVAAGLALITVFSEHPRLKKGVYTGGAFIVIAMGFAILFRSL